MKKIAPYVFALFAALPMSAHSSGPYFTLEERPVIDFVEKAVDKALSHDFASWRESLESMRSAFSTDDAYEGYKQQVSSALLPSIRAQHLMFNPQEIRVENLEKVASEAESAQWHVSGTLNLEIQSSKGASYEKRSFDMVILETKHGYGVNSVVLRNTGS